MFDNNQNPNPQAPNNLPFGQPQSPFVSPPPAQQPVSAPPLVAPAESQATAPAAAAAPVQDMFAETLPPTAPQTAGYPGVAPAYNQPTGFPGQPMAAQPAGQPAYSAYNPEMFGGRSLPWGKIISVAIIVLVVVGVAGAAYGGWLYYQSINKPAETPTAEIPAATPTAPATNTQPPVVVPAATATPATGSTAAPVVEVKDSDGDGLIDSEEEKYGTDKNLADSDSDGLTDWAEIKIYKSNPLNPDTDGDTYKDGQEVINGYDPLKPGSARLYETPKQ